MNRKRKKHELNAWLVTLIVLAAAVAVGFLAWLQFGAYEQGMLDVYAVQQDGYVQLVLDQINLIEDESDESIVNGILATLGASSYRFWTLSKDDSLIFVKDVQETNRFKGFTTAACFTSDSVMEFIKELQVNCVIHSTVELNGISYIASGVRFEYGGEEYGICLFTASAIVLENNSYLSAKMSLLILFAIILAVFVVGGLVIAVIAQNRYEALARCAEDNKRLCGQIERLTGLFTRQELYDTRYMVFGESAVDILIDKLEQRDVWPLNYIIVKCSSEEQRSRFLLDAQAFCGAEFIRALAKNNYLLIFNVRFKESSAPIIQKTAIHSGAEIVGNIVYRCKPDIPLKEAIRQYNSAIMIDENGKKLLESQNRLKESLGIGNGSGKET